MEKLIVKFPTRNRPDKFKQVFSDYVNYLDDNYRTRFVITCDENDQTMKNNKIIKWLEDQKSALEERNHSLIYHFGNNKSKIAACNANLEGESADALLLASDDMWIRVDGYNRVILEELKKYFPDGDGAIKFNDGLRSDILMTLPTIGWKWYKRFGYIYHPEYTSLYADNEQTLVANYAGRLVINETVLAEHRWTAEPFDELHARNENQKMYDIDGEIYKKRMNYRFGIDKLGIDYNWPVDPIKFSVDPLES